jgi:CubicO group peptidase (beta-lactamase class C family)
MRNFKQLFIAIFLLTTLFTSNYSSALETSQEASKKIENAAASLAEIDAIVESALDLFQVPGVAIGVIVDGEIVLSKGYGQRNREKELPVDQNTLFAIGSCTKAFTTCILGLLVDEGLITWDDPVINYIPEFCLWDAHATNHVTIRDLVSHRTGLPRHDFVWYNSDYPRTELLSRLPYLEPVCDLRQEFHYNNIMYAVAGILIERVTGKTWEEMVPSRIFDTLGMDSSNISLGTSLSTDNFSMPHIKLQGKITTIPFRHLDNVGPAGSINSNIADMLKWVQIQMSEESLVKPETRNEMHSLHMPTNIFSGINYECQGYGLGWVLGMYDGRMVIEHGGGIDGFISEVMFLPQEKIGIVILTNSMNGGKFVTIGIGNAILDKILKSEKVDWLKVLGDIYAVMQSEKEEDDIVGTTPLHPLENYCGEYEHPGYGMFKILIQDEQLHAVFNRISTPLIHKGEDVFLPSKSAADPIFSYIKLDFSFLSDVEDKVTELLVPFEKALEPIAFKKKGN